MYIRTYVSAIIKGCYYKKVVPINQYGASISLTDTICQVYYNYSKKIQA